MESALTNVLSYTSSYSHLILFAVLLSLLLWYTRLPSNLPPGPIGLPVIGYLHKLDSRMHLAFEKMGQKYGEVSSFYFGGKLTIVLNGFDNIKDAFVNHGETLSSRPYIRIVKKLLGERGIISEPYGNALREQRKIVLTAFRRFGVGKRSLENRIKEELHYLIQELDAKPINGAHNIKPEINNAVSNIICTLCFGKRFEYFDPEFKKLLSMLNDFFSHLFLFFALSLLPIIHYLPFFARKAKKSTRGLHEFIQANINEHAQSFNPVDLRDIIDIYMNEKALSNNYVTDEMIFRSIVDLFNAGTETTTSTLMWSILYLSIYPDIQDQFYKELVEVVGVNRLPSLEDKEHLSYVQAVILEIQRLANVTPVGVIHVASEDTLYRGFYIPKSSFVIGNLHTALRDPKYWENPDQFNPERFLDSNKRLSKCQAHIPFGIGRRVCLGEQLARMQVFLFLSGLIQQFKFSLPKDGPTPSLEGSPGLIRACLPYNVLISRR